MASSKTKPIGKINIKSDLQAAMKEQQAAAESVADDRFSHAANVLHHTPNGLAKAQPVESTSNEESRAIEVVKPRPLVSTQASFDLSLCVVGSIVRVPLHLIDTNPLSPRHIYTAEGVDTIAMTMPKGQDVAAHGYVQDGRIKLIDGGTRYRAAKITDTGYLDVKIEPPPESALSLYLRARALNEQRSSTSDLDFALSIKSLLEQGVVNSPREIIEKIPGPRGTPLSDATVSMYMRIARMPMKIQRAMSEHPATSSFVAMYEVSQLFGKDMDEAEMSSREDIALSVIDEIKRHELTRKQIVTLVSSKIEGPKTRQRSLVHPISLGKYKGAFKTFAARGQLDLTLKGLSEEQVETLRGRLQQTLKEFAEQPAGPVSAGM